MPGLGGLTLAHGFCFQGNRCKFSHDLNVGKKSTKIDLYTDKRDADKEADQMDSWDQSKLEEVVKEKHGEKTAKQTDIVRGAQQALLGVRC
jgi:transcription elongation factor Elf1